MKIGIVGGGQLARMLALSGLPLGHTFHCLEQIEDCPARSVAAITVDSFSPDSIRKFSEAVDVLTWEFENVPPDALTAYTGTCDACPPPEAVAVSQDRYQEKEFFRSIGAATADYALVSNIAEIAEALEGWGSGGILKTRRLGYDGKGQQRVTSAAEALSPDCEQRLNNLLQQPCILERFVQFGREIACVATRGRDGTIAWYPLTQTTHAEGILRYAAPADASPDLINQARSIATKALEKLNYVGTFAIEFFDSSGTLVVNECAPRVHNSGHWTIEGCQTSQFENHIRAVAGTTLGTTELLAPYVAMFNIIGVEVDTDLVLRIAGAHLHLYGKSPRRGRKVGHVTVRTANEQEYQTAVRALSKLELFCT
jgi:5-(carboxyamino)imidazole ribonucleotide synthase